MSIESIYSDTKDRMQKSVDHLLTELAKVRTGRATPALLDSIKVDYYGTPSPLNQVASVSAPEPRLLVVQPWEKSLIPEIEKQILAADLGLNPANDGTLVRIPIPELSDERRQQLIKMVKNFCEEARVAIRNVRRDANDQVKKLEKDHEISEDNSHDALENIQTYTNDHIKIVDGMLEKKEKELLGD